MITIPTNKLTSEHTRDAVRVDVVGDMATIYTAGDPLPAPPPMTLAEAISSTVAAIDAHAASMRDTLTAGTHPAEMARWPFKLAEAKEFDASGNLIDAPTLTIEATTRGIPVADLVAKVFAKAELLAQHEAAIAGTAGKHKDVVRAMTDVDAVLAYNWHVGWPTLE